MNSHFNVKIVYIRLTNYFHKLLNEKCIYNQTKLDADQTNYDKCQSHFESIIECYDKLFRQAFGSSTVEKGVCVCVA
jgi:hypothetical protein